VFKQRAAAQKGCGWRCDLDNAAIAVNFLPAVAGDLMARAERGELRFFIMTARLRKRASRNGSLAAWIPGAGPFREW
jgi:hypothetical protein